MLVTLAFLTQRSTLGCLMLQVSLQSWILRHCHPPGCCSSSHWSAVFSLNAVAGLGEEVGWRGWWATQRQEQNFWVNTIVIGTIWGLWHLPINMVGYNYPGVNRVAACSMFVVYCICAGALLLELRNRSHSIYPAAVAHGTINGLAGVHVLLMDSSPTMWLVYSPTGVVGCVILVVITLVLRRIPARPPQASSMNVDRPQAGMRERH